MGGIGTRFVWGHGTRDGRRLLRTEVKAGAARGDAKWVSAPFLAAAGAGRYIVSDWYRSNIESHLTLIAEDASGRQREFIDVASLPASTVWTEARGHVKVPEWAATLRVAHRIARRGWLETDQFFAARMPGAAPHPAIVSLTFDDGWRSAFAQLVLRVEAMGWRSTQYLVSGFIDSPLYASDHLTSKEVTHLIQRGHENGSHTSLHEDLAPMTLARVAADLEASKAALQALGAHVTSFAPPYGSYTEAVRKRAMRSYAAFRTANGGIQQTPYRMNELSAVEVVYDLPLARVESYLDEAENQPGGWLILLFHRAAVDSTHTAPTYITPEKFQDLLNLLKARGAIVKPVGEVLGLWTAPPGMPVVAWEGVDSPQAVKPAATGPEPRQGSRRPRR